MSFPFTYTFHPVGQGLFASGRIAWKNDGIPYRRDDPRWSNIFNWVYDCGSSTSQALVSREIDRLRRTLNRRTPGNLRDRIDLLIISHFDADHISGVWRLLEEFWVEDLVLPYMALPQRLLIAFEEGVGPDDDLMPFFINPTAFIVRLGGPGVGRIIYVPPSGDERPPGARKVTEPPPDSPERPKLSGSFQDPEDAAEVEILRGAHPKRDVVFLSPGGFLDLLSIWEFIPYNDDPNRHIDRVFRTAVAASRDLLLDSKNIKARHNALTGLRKAYDDKLGGSSVRRNLISLFLYSGPIYESMNETYLAGRLWRRFGGGSHPRLRTVSVTPRDDQHSRCSILYTGDGYLNKRPRLERLCKFVGSDRISHVGVLQVMHHGARTSWHEGVATGIEPLLSVISSDPEDERYKHPDGEVLRDFWRYRPVQVDKEEGITIYGAMEPWHEPRGHPTQDDISTTVETGQEP